MAIHAVAYSILDLTLEQAQRISQAIATVNLILPTVPGLYGVFACWPLDQPNVRSVSQEVSIAYIEAIYRFLLTNPVFSPYTGPIAGYTAIMPGGIRLIDEAPAAGGHNYYIED